MKNTVIVSGVTATAAIALMAYATIGGPETTSSNFEAAPRSADASDAELPSERRSEQLLINMRAETNWCLEDAGVAPVEFAEADEVVEISAEQDQALWSPGGCVDQAYDQTYGELNPSINASYEAELNAISNVVEASLTSHATTSRFQSCTKAAGYADVLRPSDLDFLAQSRYDEAVVEPLGVPFLDLPSLEGDTPIVVDAAKVAAAKTWEDSARAAMKTCFTALEVEERRITLVEETKLESKYPNLPVVPPATS